MEKIHLFTIELEKGLSLKKLNYFMLIAAMIISLVMIYAMHRTTAMYEEVHAVTRQLIECENDSYNLQSASDYLTDEIRLFVITGKKEHLNNYFEEAKVTKRRDKAIESLRSMQGAAKALTELENAMKDSVKLMDDEYHAARLVVDVFGYNLAEFPEEVRRVQLTESEAALSIQQKETLARDLVFGFNYRGQKNSISNHMTGCLKNLQAEIWAEQTLVSAKLQEQMFIEHVLTVVLIALLIVIVYTTSRLVIAPLQDCVNMIRENESIPIKGASEIRFLALTYNKIREANLRHRERLSYEASHDLLTGLYNRRGLEILLDDLDLTNAAVLLVDLDKFKQINDTHGHDAGDRVLVKVANTLLSHFKNEGYACRLGGDEFVVVMESATPAMKTYLTKKIQSVNETLKSPEDGVPPVTVSVGVSFCTGNTDVEELLKLADTSLYSVKERGGHGIQFNNDSESA